MHKGRLEAFSDGVIAIIVTIMVLELKTPHDSSLSALVPMMPALVGYLLSFVFVAIYWSNHHHLLQSVDRVNGSILWANSHLLFWLSLIPFTTAWMGHYPLAPWPVALYGLVLVFCAMAYTVLVRCLISHHGKKSKLATAIGSDFKGKVSLLLYISAIPIAFVSTFAAYFIYLAVAVIWIIPDRRIEKILASQDR